MKKALLSALALALLYGCASQPAEPEVTLGEADYGIDFAAIVAMFFSTQFADRNFAAERFLAVSQLIGGIAGGGKGAAIGLILGGAGGAGSLAINGSKELKLESGTEMLVHVTR